jgi:hypothetical protein
MNLEPAGKGQVGRNRLRWKDKIKMHLKGMGMS